MIIEFTGLPGSGKSTLCRELEPWLRSQGYEVINWIYHTSNMSKIHRIMHKVKVSSFFLCIHPLFFLRICKVVITSCQTSNKNIISQLLNLVYVFALYRRYRLSRYQNTVVLFDQGKVQAFISLLYSSGMSNLQDICIDSLMCSNINDAVIQIDISLEESLNRMNMRAGTQSRIERIDSDERVAALGKFKKAGAVILKDNRLYRKLYYLNSSGLSKDDVLCNVKELIIKIIKTDYHISK